MVVIVFRKGRIINGVDGGPLKDYVDHFVHHNIAPI
jgi:hypothetical protein